MAYDTIIIGAGSAGCALAHRLGQDRDRKILILEAGGSDRAMAVKIPAAFHKLFHSERDWDYQTEPEAGADDRRMFWPRGKMLGGCSSMNAQIYQRCYPADFDGWAASGNPGWGWSDVVPYFERSERHQVVSDLRDVNPLTRAFLAAARECGVNITDDFNGDEREGAGLFRVTQRRGRRWSAADAFLRPAIKRGNVEVITGAQVTRILIQADRAVGVDYVRGGKSETARASGEVVCAAGAINSPQLLMLSGIGPADQLRELDIEVVADLPDVGAGLEDHLVVGVITREKTSLSLVSAESPMQLLRYFVARRGMLTSNVAEAAAFVRSRDDLEAPDLELIFAPVPFIDHAQVEPDGHGLTLAPILLQPKSSGAVTLASSDPTAPPKIHAGYLSDPDGADLALMIEGVERAREILAAPALSEHVGEGLEPLDSVTSREDIEAFVRQQSETLYHPTGTCRMGAVVDAELKVRGVDGLRVVDASIMPRIVRGHPNATCLMIGERAADLIAGVESPGEQARTSARVGPQLDAAS